MARYCELCKKKMGISDSCTLMYFVHQPYQSVIKKVVVPGSYGSCLCEECMRMVNYLFSYKWTNKQDAISNMAINHSDECTNDDIIYAQEYVKNRLNTVTDKSFKSFFENALSVSKEIFQRRSSFIKIKEDMKKKLQDFFDERKKQMDFIKSSFVSDAFYGVDATYGLTNTDLVICYDINFVSEKSDMDIELHTIFNKIDQSTPMDNIERIVQEYIDKFNKEITPYHYELSQIKYYKVVDTRQYVSNVHGGGGSGGGANLSGAVIGGALFGGAGAIIGSQVGTEIKIDPIKTDITEVGKCITTLYCTRPIEIELASAPKAFECLIPQKSYEYVIRNAGLEQSVESANAPDAPAKSETVTNSKTTNIADELRLLKSLLDEGILTQEEFDQKKKELLSL